MHTTIVSTCILAIAAALAGCATDLSGDVYSRSEARETHAVIYGTITETRPVIIDGTQTGVGSVIGTASGAVAGSGIGGDRESAIASILIGTAGGIIGNTVEEKMTRAQGLEMVLALDNGRVLSLVQEVDSVDDFFVGQRIKLLDSGQNKRVSPVNE